jgi:hypothetical protein
MRAASPEQSLRLATLLQTLTDAGLGTLIGVPSPALPAPLAEHDAPPAGVTPLAQSVACLEAMTDWLAARREWHSLPFGYLASGGEVSAALLAAARRKRLIRGVVACAGRPLLSGDAIRHVHATTLLIVDPEDPAQVTENREAQHALRATNALKTIAGANDLLGTHEATTMVSMLARDWFLGIFNHSRSFRPRH